MVLSAQQNFDVIGMLGLAVVPLLSLNLLLGCPAFGLSLNLLLPIKAAHGVVRVPPTTINIMLPMYDSVCLSGVVL